MVRTHFILEFLVTIPINIHFGTISQIRRIMPGDRTFRPIRRREKGRNGNGPATTTNGTRTMQKSSASSKELGCKYATLLRLYLSRYFVYKSIRIFFRETRRSIWVKPISTFHISLIFVIWRKSAPRPDSFAIYAECNRLRTLWWRSNRTKSI